MALDFYETPRAEFSQGDILELAPHIYLDEPPVPLRPAGDKTYAPLEGGALPGQSAQKVQAVISKNRPGMGVIMTHDCIMDKRTRWQLCPVVPLAEAGKAKFQDLVKRNRIYSHLFLPAHGTSLRESFIDFDQICTVHADLIKKARRILSLSDVGRHSLYAQFIRWHARLELADINCPACGVIIDPGALLPRRN